jgi:IS30 family transposase
LKKAGHRQVEIAALLDRSPATISRELRRNSGLRGYRPKQAQRLMETRRTQAFKARKVTDEVRRHIETLIRQELSPQQTVDYLARRKVVSLHHETVYSVIYADKAAGGDLYRHLRIAAKPYRKRYGHYDRRGKIPHRVSIDARPAIVDQRRRIGDWEGDTVIGRNRKSALLTLVERKTLYTVIVRLSGKRADLLAKAAIQHLLPFRQRVKTITFDNGLEFAHHQDIARKLATKIYFAHPFASWERGINENTNGLIRQYFPKGTDFNQVTDAQIKRVAERLNDRPRKTRGGRLSNELFLKVRTDLLVA